MEGEEPREEACGVLRSFLAAAAVPQSWGRGEMQPRTPPDLEHPEGLRETAEEQSHSQSAGAGTSSVPQRLCGCGVVTDPL